MPTRSPAKKKKVTKARSKKKTVARKVAKKVVKKVMKKAVAKKPKMIGEVIHYYDRIGVAIVELKIPMMVGDVVLFKRGEMELFEQRVDSMQIDHAPVSKAKKGDVIGVRVMRETPEGTMVLPR